MSNNARETVLIVLLIATVITHRRGSEALNQLFGQILAAIVTIFMVWSLVLLVRAVPAQKEAPLNMLRSAAALWVTNVLVFAYWYWRLDDGGPHERNVRSEPSSPAFLFPQMSMQDPAHEARWTPEFIDYLFLAFNTSTAFSPTDFGNRWYLPVRWSWASATSPRTRGRHHT